MRTNNYISFSLWGNKEIFTIGAIRNVELARKTYKGWEVIVYYDDTVPKHIIDELVCKEVVLMNMTESKIYGLFWRFLAADLPDAKYVIFRDTDSRLSYREWTAVNEWIKNGKDLHIMRDHPFHAIPFGATSLSILGGMWGIKGGVMNITDEIEEFIKIDTDEYGVDQKFLVSVYDRFLHSKTVHDEFFDKKPFPVKRKSFRFIGERIDENEIPVGDDWRQIKLYYKEHYPSLFRRIKKFWKNIFK